MKKYCVPCYRKPHQKSKRSHKLLLLHIYFPHMPISLSSFVFRLLCKNSHASNTTAQTLTKDVKCSYLLFKAICQPVAVSGHLIHLIPSRLGSCSIISHHLNLRLQHSEMLFECIILLQCIVQYLQYDGIHGYPPT